MSTLFGHDGHDGHGLSQSPFSINHVCHVVSETWLVSGKHNFEDNELLIIIKFIN